MVGSGERFWTWGEDVAVLGRIVARGGVLVIPTESSYALAADPRRRDSMDAVFRIKRRAPDQPLPVVVSGVEMFPDLGIEPLTGGSLGGLERGWPGALSILLPCGPDLPAAAGSGYLAVRVPGHPGLVTLLAELGISLTATSANRSGDAPILDPKAAVELVGEEDAMIVDDGLLPGGLPSTLVRPGHAGASILRHGRVTRQELAGLAPQWFSAGLVENPVEESR